MNQIKLETISNLFEGKEISCIWDSEKEEYYFSVVDVINALTDSIEPRKYWSVLKNRLKKEGSELTTKCSQLKMKAPDGKIRLNVLDTKGYFSNIKGFSVQNLKNIILNVLKAKKCRHRLHKFLGHIISLF